MGWGQRTAPRSFRCAVAVVVAVAVAACSSTTGGRPEPASASGSGAATSAAPAAQSVKLAAALQAVPASATGFDFVDLAAMKARWGMPGLTSRVDVDGPVFQEYVRRSRNEAAGPIAADTVPMVQDWGWSWLDVVWSISPTLDGPPATVYRLRDGLDMTVVGDGLVKNGFTRSGPEDRPVFRIDVAKMGEVVPFFVATLLPQRHLLIAGNEPQPVLSTLRNPATSLAGNATVGRLAAGSPDPDYLYLALGAGACSAVGDLLGPAASPEAVTQLGEELARTVHGWHRLDGWAAGVTGGDRAVVSADFASAADASADAHGRERFLRTGESSVQREPYSEFFTFSGGRVDGRTLRYDITVTLGSALLMQMIYQRDTPWALCP